MTYNNFVIIWHSEKFESFSIKIIRMSTSRPCMSKMWGLKSWEAYEFKKWGLEPNSLIEIYAYGRKCRK